MLEEQVMAYNKEVEEFIAKYEAACIFELRNDQFENFKQAFFKANNSEDTEEIATLMFQQDEKLDLTQKVITEFLEYFIRNVRSYPKPELQNQFLYKLYSTKKDKDQLEQDELAYMNTVY